MNDSSKHRNFKIYMCGLLARGGKRQCQQKHMKQRNVGRFTRSTSHVLDLIQYQIQQVSSSDFDGISHRFHRRVKLFFFCQGQSFRTKARLSARSQSCCETRRSIRLLCTCILPICEKNLVRPILFHLYGEEESVFLTSLRLGSHS
jgi:hypothetical protein